MGKLLKFLVVGLLLLNSTLSLAQMNDKIIVLDDVTLHVMDNQELILDLCESNNPVIERKVEIYQILFDLPVVDSNGEPNGVILNWDSTKYSAKWFQTPGEYILKVTYSNNKIQNKQVSFTIK